MLDQDQIAFYRDNGYLHVRGLFPPTEAAAFRQEAHDLIQRVSSRQSV
ncbi:MAG: phytanoyl-CoA dioxygenase family protein [Chloroflexota bacterium]